MELFKEILMMMGKCLVRCLKRCLRYTLIAILWTIHGIHVFSVWMRPRLRLAWRWMKKTIRMAWTCTKQAVKAVWVWTKGNCKAVICGVVKWWLQMRRWCGRKHEQIEDFRRNKSMKDLLADARSGMKSAVVNYVDDKKEDNGSKVQEEVEIVDEKNYDRYGQKTLDRINDILKQIVE